MYPTEVERRADGISFRVQRCPLKDAWRDAGVGDGRLQTLCRIAGAFDRGLFEATGICFTNRTWQVGDGDHCCEIHLTNATHLRERPGMSRVAVLRESLFLEVDDDNAAQRHQATDDAQCARNLAQPEETHE